MIRFLALFALACLAVLFAAMIVGALKIPEGSVHFPGVVLIVMAVCLITIFSIATSRRT